MQESGGKKGTKLPDTAHSVLIESSIIANNGHIFCLGLSDQQPIKRISMRSGQQPCTYSVISRYKQLLKSFSLQMTRKIRYYIRYAMQFA